MHTPPYIRHYIERMIELYNRKGIRALIQRSIVLLYQNIVPTRTALIISKTKYRIKGHSGIGDPSNIYYVDPDRIEQSVSSQEFSQPLPRFAIVGGDWYNKSRPVVHSDNLAHKMLIEHFNEGKEWEETTQYPKIVERIKSGERYGRLDKKEQSVSDLNRYLQYLDDLYESIATEGYKPQSQLARNHEYIDREPDPYLNEIQVVIGPEGEIFHVSGGHRLIMAKILNVNKIPVRTRIRHSEWQRVRDVIASKDNLTEVNKETYEFVNHPELESLID